VLGVGVRGLEKEGVWECSGRAGQLFRNNNSTYLTLKDFFADKVVMTAVAWSGESGGGGEGGAYWGQGGGVQ
jgi:hypothetical protein